MRREPPPCGGEVPPMAPKAPGVFSGCLWIFKKQGGGPATHRWFGPDFLFQVTVSHSVGPRLGAPSPRIQWVQGGGGGGLWS